MTPEEALKQLDQAISDLFKAAGSPRDILTGWVLTGAVKNTERGERDGYFIQASDGLPYHSQLGLLAHGLETTKNSVLIRSLKEVGS
jgi:hypothetical protein